MQINKSLQNYASKDENPFITKLLKKQKDESTKLKIQEYQRIDKNVREHEAAHGATGAPSFSYKLGPDGRLYAVAGEVGVSLERGKSPEECLVKMAGVIAAALAPANPSPQDRRVAAKAASLQSEARIEIIKNKQEENNKKIDEKEAQEKAKAAYSKKEEKKSKGFLA